jgi:hypothetical protein
MYQLKHAADALNCDQNDSAQFLAHALQLMATLASLTENTC